MYKAILSFFTRNKPDAPAVSIYRAIVAQSRTADFYLRHGVPDSLDGRFDMIVLHAFLVLRRIGKMPGEQPRQLSQKLFDLLFADMDSNLREIGVGDLGVGRKVKTMAQAFFGRVEAYEAGLAAEDTQKLIDSLRRNLYGTVAEPNADWLESMAAYLKDADAFLANQPDRDLTIGMVNFPPPAPARTSIPGR